MAHEFSCCAFYEKCDYGRLECYFAESDPTKKERCRCFQIKHSNSNQTVTETERNTKDVIENDDNNELFQLSLF